MPKVRRELYLDLLKNMEGILKNIVFLASDGAPVNNGLKSGLITLLNKTLSGFL